MSDEHQELLNHDAEMAQEYGELGIGAAGFGKGAAAAAEVLEGGTMTGAAATEGTGILLEGATSLTGLGAGEAIGAGVATVAEAAVGAEVLGAGVGAAALAEGAGLAAAAAAAAPIVVGVAAVGAALYGLDYITDGALSHGAEAVGGALADGAEAVGGALADGAGAIGAAAEEIWDEIF